MAPSCSTTPPSPSSPTSTPTTSTTTARRRRSRRRSSPSPARRRSSSSLSSDDPGAVRVTRRLAGTRVVTFGEDAGADVRVHSIVTDGPVAFGVAWAGRDYFATLRIPGRHNAINAAGAFAVLVGLGFEPAASLDAISTFGGTERRFELHGTVGGVSVYDDYAHHPTEVAAALSAARSVVGNGRIIAVHQPHLYSRTQAHGAANSRTRTSSSRTTPSCSTSTAPAKTQSPASRGHSSPTGSRTPRAWRSCPIGRTPPDYAARSRGRRHHHDPQLRRRLPIIRSCSEPHAGDQGARMTRHRA